MEIDQTNYHLRNTATDPSRILLQIPKPKREKYSGATLWNQLPIVGKLAKSLGAFKSIVG